MPDQHVAFRCGSCGLRFEADVGGEGKAFRRAFWCPRDEKVLALDVLAPGFDAHCPTCKELMDLLADFPLDACPRCHSGTGRDKTPRKGTSISREGGTGR